MFTLPRLAQVARPALTIQRTVRPKSDSGKPNPIASRLSATLGYPIALKSNYLDQALAAIHNGRSDLARHLLLKALNEHQLLSHPVAREKLTKATQQMIDALDAPPK